MNPDPAVIQQGAVRQNTNHVIFHHLAVIYELSGRRIAQASSLNMKSPGGDSCRDEKIARDAPRKRYGQVWVGLALRVED